MLLLCEKCGGYVVPDHVWCGTYPRFCKCKEDKKRGGEYENS